MLATVPLGLALLFDEGQIGSLMLMFAPLIITVPCVLVASIVFGLPLTACLSHLGKERGEYYVFAGTALGALPFIVLMFWKYASTDLGYIAVMGAIGGAATGWQWGRYRDDAFSQDNLYR